MVFLRLCDGLGVLKCNHHGEESMHRLTGGPCCCPRLFLPCVHGSSNISSQIPEDCLFPNPLLQLRRALWPYDIAGMMLQYKGRHRVYISMFINMDSDQRNKTEFNNVDPHRAVRQLTGPAFSSHTLFGEGNSWIPIRIDLLYLPSSSQAPAFIIW